MGVVDDARLTTSRFHPMAWSTGTVSINGKTIDATGDAVFIHAIQSGMRPNLVRCSLLRGESC